MGGAVSAIGDAFGGVVDFVGDTIESVGDVVGDAFDAVGDVLSSVGNAVIDGVEAIGDLLGDVADFAQVMIERYAIQAALMAVGVPPQVAAPMSAGMHTLAKGGSPEDALKSSATYVVVDQVGKYVATEMQVANADAIAQGGQAVYTANEIAAATSAAQSAVATAAAGGDINDVLKGAGIGAVAAVSATEVYKKTGSLAAANATRVATQTALSGAKIEQAILMGASAGMVTYLQEMDAERQRIQTLSEARDNAIEAYRRRADSYNDMASRYNDLKNQGPPTKGKFSTETNKPYYDELNNLRSQLDRELSVVNSLSDQIGYYNQQIKNTVDVYMEKQAKAEAEASKLKVEFDKTTKEQLESEQQQRDQLTSELNRLVAETEGRRYEGIEVAGELPAGIAESFRSLPLVGEDVVSESESRDAIRRTVTGTDANGQEYSYNIVIDKTDGSVFYEVLGGDETGTTTIAYDERPVFGEGTSPGQTATVEEIVARQPTLTETEIQNINETLLGVRGGALRSAAEDYLFEQELEGLEAELAQAASEAEKSASRAQFVQQQRDRLAQSQRLPGGLQAQINAELNQILDEYERSKGEATKKATQKEQIVATQQERRGTVSDEEVMRLLGISPEEGGRYGLGIGGGGAGFEGIPEGTIQEEEPALEGEMELGGGEGEGEPTEQRFDELGRPIMTTVTIRPGRDRQVGTQARGQTPGIPSRVTGEALVGILGEKEPLFGGDEDQQQAVWNRRSLRLRKALGL
jgi:uncharacterized protein (DUF2164 family)